MDPNETLNSGNQDGKGNAKLFSNEFKAAKSSDESDNESTRESSSSGSQDEDNGNVPAISVVTIRCTNCGNNMHQQQKKCDTCGSTSEAVNVGGMIKKSESEFVSHETKFCTDFKVANIGRENKSKSESASIAPKIIADCETANIGNVSVSKMSLDEIDCKNCEHTVNQDQIFCDRCGYKLKTECVGTRDGKPCSNIISRTSKFCTDCGTENLENKPGSYVYDIPVSASVVVNKCTNCGTKKLTHQKLCVKCGYKFVAGCVGKINGIPCSKFVSSETKFCVDCWTENFRNLSVSTTKSVKNECQNCGQNIHQDQLFCLKCGYKLKDLCVGKTNGKPCSKYISSESKFCADCEKANTSVLVKSPLSRSCKRCGHGIHQTQKFCDNCGYKIDVCPGKIDGNPCTKATNSDMRFCSDCGTINPDYIKGSLNSKGDGDVNISVAEKLSIRRLVTMGFTREQAIESLQSTGGNVEKAIEMILSLPDSDNNMLRENQPSSAEQFKSQIKVEKSSLPIEGSVMKLTSMGYTRNQSLQALECSGGKVEEAVDWLLSHQLQHDVVKPALSEAQYQTQSKEQIPFRPRNESVIEIMTLGFTKEQAIEALFCTNGNTTDAVIMLISQPVESDVLVEKKVEFFKEEEEIKDSDFEECQDSDEEIQCVDIDMNELKEEIDAVGSPLTSDLSPDEHEKTVIEINRREIKILRRLKKDGVIATAKFLLGEATKWKKTKVKIAVAGQSSSGKSSFINVIRGVGYKDKGYAPVGYGDTTLEVKAYVHPKYKQILYYDLPGYGTTTITRDKFLEKVTISDYDIFIIFFSSVPTTDDAWLVGKLEEAEKPFCFVRTKLDQDVDNGKQVGKSKDQVLADIRQTIDRAKKSMPALNEADIFIISTRKPSVGEMSKLVKFMKQRVTTVKFEAILISLPAFTKEIIENKYKDLLVRITNVAYLHAMYYSSFYANLMENSFSYDDNIRTEITMYFKVFELDSASAKTVPDLKHYFSDEHILKLLKLFQDEMPGVGVRLVPIYSVIKKYRVCKQYLTNLLNELKADAYTMFMEITKHKN